MPCRKCGAARACEHREYTAPVLAKEPDKYGKGLARPVARKYISGGGTYSKKKRTIHTDAGKNSGTQFRF